MADLVTLSDAKTYLQIDFADDDALLQQLISAASAAVEKYVGSPFALTDTTELLDGGFINLLLSTRPINQIIAVTDQGDGSVMPATAYGFDAQAGAVFRTDGGLAAIAWGEGTRRWKVEYRGGYEGAPPDVQQAALMLIAARYNRRESLRAESLGDYSYQAEGGLPTEAAALLEKYRERPL